VPGLLLIFHHYTDVPLCCMNFCCSDFSKVWLLYNVWNSVFVSSLGMKRTSLSQAWEWGQCLYFRPREQGWNHWQSEWVVNQLTEWITKTNMTKIRLHPPSVTCSECLLWLETFSHSLDIPALPQLLQPFKWEETTILSFCLLSTAW